MRCHCTACRWDGQRFVRMLLPCPQCGGEVATKTHAQSVRGYQVTNGGRFCRLVPSKFHRLPLLVPVDGNAMLFECNGTPRKAIMRARWAIRRSENVRKIIAESLFADTPLGQWWAGISAEWELKEIP